MKPTGPPLSRAHDEAQSYGDLYKSCEFSLAKENIAQPPEMSVCVYTTATHGGIPRP